MKKFSDSLSLEAKLAAKWQKEGELIYYSDC